ncbi:MAG: phosphotransacetylase [Mycobacteriales bacterium]
MAKADEGSGFVDAHSQPGSAVVGQPGPEATRRAGTPSADPDLRAPSPPAAGALAALEELTGSWVSAVAARSPRVLLADGDDPRSIEAASWLVRYTTVLPILVSTAEALRRALGDSGVQLPSAVEVLDLGSKSLLVRHRGVLADAYTRRGLPASEGELKVSDPIWLAAAALALGDADAMVGGARRATAEVIRAALRVIGLRPTARNVTSSFLMLLADGGQLAYGDCGVIPEPTAEQLAEIATETGETYRQLTGRQPIIALLSFSTKGSARHPSAEKVRRATELAQSAAPDVEIDGELQFDAAYLRAVGERKAPGSTVTGRANVFVFPNLDAGNIAYKITERLAGAVALGPILQGLGAVVNDLSRGCSAQDVARVALISAVQSVARNSVQSAAHNPGE